MPTWCETERLILRRITADDVDAIVALHTDPAVMRFLGPPTETADGVRDRWLPRVERLYEQGFGHYAAIERATGAFLGWFLFRPPRGDPPAGEVELGYRLHVAAWGRGFATEGSRAIVEKAFRESDVARIVATTMTVNAGSRRVLEEAGPRYLRTYHEQHDEPVDGVEHGDAEYALTRAEWRAAAPGPCTATPR